MNLPELPECAKHVWDWYQELDSKRTWGMSSANPISFLEIDSWSKLTKNNLLQWELDAINSIDTAYRNSTTTEP